MKKKILIIGSGGREHALGWKLKQSSKVGKIYFAPGNGGTEQIGENLAIKTLDVNALLDFAQKNKIDLTIVGPDDALALGVVDAFQKKNLRIFGPTKKAAELEWSKSFSKQFMVDVGIPTASFTTFKDIAKTKTYIHQQKMPIVIKASGLALGKGVIIAQTLDEALRAIDDIMLKRIFGNAGNEIVVEEYLEGKEISIHVFSDGENISLFPTSRDHKRLRDGNKGTNTGGMGVIAPLADMTKKDLDVITKAIILPAIEGMKKRKRPFAGLLYPGIMITKNGLRVLEFNARFGDPETQVFMRLLKTDLFDILNACATGNLKDIKIEWENKFACCIVLASEGYPEKPKKGEIIHGIKETKKDKDIIIFHAGTKIEKGDVITNGGRVLGVSVIGDTMDAALDKAYSVIGENGIYFKGMQYRKDIGRA